MNTKITWVISAPFSRYEIDFINSMFDNPKTEVKITNSNIRGFISSQHKLTTDITMVKIIVRDKKYNTLIRLIFGDKARIDSFI